MVLGFYFFYSIFSGTFRLLHFPFNCLFLYLWCHSYASVKHFELPLNGAIEIKSISLLSLYCSMTELEKDIGNMRSGLKSVESVSAKIYEHRCFMYRSRRCKAFGAGLRSNVAHISPLRSLSISLSGVGISEEAAAGARRQVCVGGESVHHRGQLQLLWCGGLARRGQRTGTCTAAWFISARALKSEETVCVCVCEQAALQTSKHTPWEAVSISPPSSCFDNLLTSSATFLGKQTAGLECYSFLLFVAQPVCGLVCRSKVEPGTQAEA